MTENLSSTAQSFEDSQPPRIKMKGKVFLVGVSSGAGERLSERALHVLRSAELVLHDESVSDGILDLVPAWTQICHVGNRSGRQAWSSEQILHLLLSGAREGRQVIRLKVGAPSSPACFTEESQALREVGVDVEVVPAAVSTIGAPVAANPSFAQPRHVS